jgi:phosphoribosylamine--glycine ligase
MGLDWQTTKAVTVVIASCGYPGHYEKGKVITGLEEVAKEKGVVAFHAGTKSNTQHHTVTSGGRVLGVTALDNTLAGAVSKAYQAVGKLHFDGAFYRTDIASKALKYER